MITIAALALAGLCLVLVGTGLILGGILLGLPLLTPVAIIIAIVIVLVRKKSKITTKSNEFEKSNKNGDKDY